MQMANHSQASNTIKVDIKQLICFEYINFNVLNANRLLKLNRKYFQNLCDKTYRFPHEAYKRVKTLTDG